MAFDWLYGPRTAYRSQMPGVIPTTEYDPLSFRGVVMDTDDLIDVRDLLIRRIEAFPNANIRSIFSVVRLMNTREVDAADLAGLADYEKQNLSLMIEYSADGIERAHVSVTVGKDQIPTIHADSSSGWEQLAAITEMKKAAADRIVSSGPPIIQWTRLASPAIFLAWLSLVAALVWVQATGTTPALTVFSVILTGFALVGAVALARHVRTKLEGKHTGCRMRSENRATTRARQTDERTRVKTALVTALVVLPVTVAGTLLATWITGTLNLDGKTQPDTPTSVTTPAR